GHPPIERLVRNRVSVDLEEVVEDPLPTLNVYAPKLRIFRHMTRQSNSVRNECSLSGLPPHGIAPLRRECAGIMTISRQTERPQSYFSAMRASACAGGNASPRGRTSVLPPPCRDKTLLHPHWL